MSNTALIYSPEGGSANSITNKLGELIGIEKVDIIHVSKIAKEDLQKYKQLIFIGSTVGADHWSNESIEDEWQEFFIKTDDLSFEDKKVAIVGLGNSVLYPEHFADGIAHLYKAILKKKAKILGFVHADDYTFTDSEALNDEGYFCGLPIDEDNEEELSEERLKKWISLLKSDFDF